MTPRLSTQNPRAIHYPLAVMAGSTTGAAMLAQHSELTPWSAMSQWAPGTVKSVPGHRRTLAYACCSRRSRMPVSARNPPPVFLSAECCYGRAASGSHSTGATQTQPALHLRQTQLAESRDDGVLRRRWTCQPLEGWRTSIGGTVPVEGRARRECTHCAQRLRRVRGHVAVAARTSGGRLLGPTIVRLPKYEPVCLDPGCVAAPLVRLPVPPVVA